MSERKRTAVRAAPRRNAGKAEVVDRGKLWRRVSVSFDEHAHDMIRFHLSGRPARGGIGLGHVGSIRAMCATHHDHSRETCRVDQRSRNEPYDTPPLHTFLPLLLVRPSLADAPGDLNDQQRADPLEEREEG
jgi:hypothetical protein